LNSARQPDGDPIPQKAKARIERLLDRLELVLKLIGQVESERDAVLKKDAPADEAERMIRSLTDLRSIGPDVATLLVREAFVRQFRNRRALAGYVGLGGTPFSSGGSEREQGIGKDGNRRVRAAMVELAWMWLRWQSDSALSVWFRARAGAMGRADQENHDPLSLSLSLWPSEVTGWRSPQKPEGPSGRRCEDWTRRKELLFPDAGIVVGDRKIPPDTRLAGS